MSTINSWDKNLPLSLKKKIAHLIIREYAAASFTYEKLSTSIMDDSEFDDLAKFIGENYYWLSTYDINKYLPSDGLFKSGMYTASKVSGLTKQYTDDRVSKVKD